MKIKLLWPAALTIPMLAIAPAAWATDSATSSPTSLRLAQQQSQDKEQKPGQAKKPAPPHAAPQPQRPAVQPPPMQPHPPAAQGQPPRPAPQPPRPTAQPHPLPPQHPTVQGQPPKPPAGQPAPQRPAAQQPPAQPQRPTDRRPPVPPQPPAAQGQPPKPTVQGQPPKPAVQGQPPKPAVQAQPPKPAIQGQPPKPAQAQPPKPTVQQPPAMPQRPVVQQPATPTQPPAAQGQPPKPAAQGQPPKPAAQGLPPMAPIQGQLPQPAKAANQIKPPVAGANAPRRIEELRGQRKEVREGNKSVIQEPGRTIIREGGRTVIRHDEIDRFRYNARDVRIERRGNEHFAVVDRPNGVRIITVLDADGHLLRRIRRGPDGREIIIIDNTYRGAPSPENYILRIAPPVVRIPRDRYIVEADRADERMIYDALIAPPVQRLDRRFTLDEIRYNHAVREWMPRVDLDTITFDTGSWDVAPDQAQRLAPIAQAIKAAIRRNPREVFLVEGHTDAVGPEDDNLSLSDRRAESVATVLTEEFDVPPENLTTQGYGEQYLKIPTQEPERRNRRVTIRRITPLLTGQNP